MGRHTVFTRTIHVGSQALTFIFYGMSTASQRRYFVIGTKGDELVGFQITQADKGGWAISLDAPWWAKNVESQLGEFRPKHKLKKIAKLSRIKV